MKKELKMPEGCEQISFNSPYLVDQIPILWGNNAEIAAWKCPRCYAKIQTAMKCCPNCKVTFDWKKAIENVQRRNARKSE